MSVWLQVLLFSCCFLAAVTHSRVKRRVCGCYIVVTSTFYSFFSLPIHCQSHTTPLKFKFQFNSPSLANSLLSIVGTRYIHLITLDRVAQENFFVHSFSLPLQNISSFSSLTTACLGDGDSARDDNLHLWTPKCH